MFLYQQIIKCLIIFYVISFDCFVENCVSLLWYVTHDFMQFLLAGTFGGLNTTLVLLVLNETSLNATAYNFVVNER